MEPAIIYTGYDAISRLHELDLTEQPILRAVRIAGGYAAECTEDSPPTERSFLLWAKTVGGLRYGLADSEWRRNETNRSYPLVIHPERKLAIAVAGGDEDTGREDGQPCTKSTKGRSTRQAIHPNQAAFDLGDIARVAREEGLPTWVLLVHEDQEANEIRIELSLPKRVNADGYISEWLERIIITPVGFDESYATPELTDEVDIDIRRKELGS